MTRDPNAATRAELRQVLERKRRGGYWLNADVEMILSSLPALLDEIDAAHRFLTKLGSYCWKCHVLDERIHCECKPTEHTSQRRRAGRPRTEPADTLELPSLPWEDR